MSNLVPIERIESKIYLIRGQKVMLDYDLALLYDVPTKVLNQAVKRNKERFPDDFMFQLTWSEIERLRSQFVTLKDKEGANLKSQFVTSSLPARLASKRAGKAGWGGRRKRPYAFTENGVAMLSSVLSSKYAVQVNIQIMRAFTRLRQIIARNKDLTYLFKELKHKVDQHDVEIGLIIQTIEKMISADKQPKEEIGFHSNSKCKD